MLLVAIACAAAAYFVANWIGDTLIEKVYLDQKAMQKRERAIVSELQTYVQENRISSRDTDAVARWSMSKSDTYVMLYRNQRLAFEAGWWGVDDVDETDAPPLLSNSAGVYPIYFTDGPMQAVVYDFSESRLYTLTTIVSVLIGCFVLMCFMLSYNGRITRTIVTIAAEVEQIGRGDLTARLEKPRGNDELAGLTESVERMRASLLHKTEEEQKALKQNSDLITALSHDIRNPLTALLGYLDIISAQRDLPPDTASYLAACQERAGRIKQLTDELFRYSLLFSNDELPMRLETYDAYVLLEQLLGEAQAGAGERGFCHADGHARHVLPGARGCAVFQAGARQSFCQRPQICRPGAACVHRGPAREPGAAYLHLQHHPRRFRPGGEQQDRPAHGGKDSDADGRQLPPPRGGGEVHRRGHPSDRPGGRGRVGAA